MPEEVSCGVSTSIFGHRMSLTPEKIRTLADTGIEWIEIAALQSQHVNIWDEEHLGALLEAVPGTGLKVWSFHAPFCAVSMDDEATRDAGIRRLCAALVAERFGAPVVVVHPGRDVPSVDIERETLWTVESMLRALDGAPESVKLALETMGPNSPAGPPEGMASVMARLPADRIGVCVDTGHVHQNWDVVEYIRAVSGRIASVHLQDNMGDRDSHLLAGDGSVDFPSALKALREAGYDGVLMSEGASPGTPEENAREFVKRMKGFTRQSGL